MTENHSQPIPLMEFDPSKEAITEPSRMFARKKIPETCLLCYYHGVIEQLNKEQRIKQIYQMNTSVFENWPIYEMEIRGKKITLVNPGIGGPLASMVLEFLIATGCTKFIALGSGGTLDPKLKAGQLVVINAAIRDEGTSYHYLPPSREIQADPEMVQQVCDELKKRDVNFITAKTWTTDAFCRETPNKIATRAKEGAKTVEMEAASLLAVAQFRNVPLGYLIYCGDDVSGKIWNQRAHIDSTPIREQLFWLSTELCLTF